MLGHVRVMPSATIVLCCSLPMPPVRAWLLFHNSDHLHLNASCFQSHQMSSSGVFCLLGHIVLECSYSITHVFHQFRLCFPFVMTMPDIAYLSILGLPDDLHLQQACPDNILCPSSMLTLTHATHEGLKITGTHEDVLDMRDMVKDRPWYQMREKSGADLQAHLWE
ncbi:hypothetical protein SODALDRAFT_359200 [Sodiomyces alkalinus F11]|uniref:Uncharacterized protein n=1 Tax=Sodiomyces alkalinus (strain CBS 110278 / VKM F-3762 / F11) TaxID=1314773 RepID=A0A3N2PXX4_SODAK|nr:hypothetical protein SODALDRAFT_359200 [Sodiomyces alkalinus F11]ROT39318.1 hypothetical protein SODALDRAFT_359200 [Sodiomyces alkalinus F11]